MRAVLFGCFGSPSVKLDKAVPSPLECSDLSANKDAKAKHGKTMTTNHSVSCPEIGDPANASCPTAPLPTKSISGCLPPDSQVPPSETSVKKAHDPVQFPEELISSRAFLSEAKAEADIAVDKIQSKAPRSPAPISRRQSLQHSERKPVDRDPLATRMKCILDRAYGVMPATQTPQPTDIETITRIAHQRGRGVDYQANLDRWRAREELRRRNAQVLNHIASDPSGTAGNVPSSPPRSLTHSEEVILNYLYAHRMLLNGGGRYPATPPAHYPFRYPEPQRLAYDKTPTVYSNVQNPPFTFDKVNSNQAPVIPSSTHTIQTARQYNTDA